MSFRFSLSASAADQIDPEALIAITRAYTAVYPAVTAVAELQLVTAEEMQRLNREQRQLDEPTDVLSFPTYATLAEILAEKADVLIGSIVICPEKATAYNETLPQLVHHGLLHLLGFDHEENPVEWKHAEIPLITALNKEGLTIPPLL